MSDRGAALQKLGAFSGASRYSTGRYQVYHNIGHVNYVPTVTTQGSGTLIAMLKNITGTYFEVEVSDDAGNYEDGALPFNVWRRCKK
ncbi:hypothetical protein [Porphyromonas cangingivalis]|uniref:hypothetical protein n=1 Tax=Porphyromonas cangingivalis TaxID=36874 RepID=UPI0004724C5B|nr:hypothetical protein [Porphyromonas cangingivalis]